MDRTEAFSTLRLDGTADGALVESAYWHLVREAQQRASQDDSAHAEIERLNQARDILAPSARNAPQRAGTNAQRLESAGGTGIALLDAFADWVSAEALRTRMRWPKRNPEIALIGGAAIVLWILALGAGASVTATFIAIGLLLAAIWAPWRRI